MTETLDLKSIVNKLKNDINTISDNIQENSLEDQYKDSTIKDLEEILNVNIEDINTKMYCYTNYINYNLEIRPQYKNVKSFVEFYNDKVKREEDAHKLAYNRLKKYNFDLQYKKLINWHYARTINFTIDKFNCILSILKKQQKEIDELKAHLCS